MTDPVAGPLRSRSYESRTGIQAPEPDERGAVLLLALAFIVVVSVVVAALALWATSDVNNSTIFYSASAQNYAANAATQAAVEAIGATPEPSSPTSAYNATTNQNGTPLIGDNYPSSPGVCWGTSTSSSVTIPGSQIGPGSQTGPAITMSVWCSTIENLTNIPGTTNTRVVTIYTCLSTVATAALCEASPLVKAVVGFDDYPGPKLTTQCSPATQTCGQSATVISWVSVDASGT